MIQNHLQTPAVVALLADNPKVYVDIHWATWNEPRNADKFERIPVRVDQVDTMRNGVKLSRPAVVGYIDVAQARELFDNRSLVYAQVQFEGCCVTHILCAEDSQYFQALVAPDDTNPRNARFVAAEQARFDAFRNLVPSEKE